jgi:hypothetical protein
MEVGSFHTRLVVRVMIFTTSVRNILETPSYVADVSSSGGQKVANGEQYQYDS